MYDKDGGQVMPFRDSDILSRNGSAYDAYGIYLKRTEIGNFVMHSRIEIDVPRDQQRRLEYFMGETKNGTLWGNLAYRHNLTPWLEEVFVAKQCEQENKILCVPLTASYKDSLGNRFETDFSLEYHPHILGFPKISIVGSRRVAPPTVNAIEA
jgi:hypothetical protein